MKRRLERRESCDRCLAMRLKEDIASRGSDIEPMPSRAYHKIQDDHIRISPTPTSPTHDYSPTHNTRTPPTPPTPSTATSPSFISPVPMETVPNPYPLVGKRYHELDVEQKHVTYLPTSPTSPRYRFEDSDDDEPAPPTPPPKLQYREREVTSHEVTADESSFSRFQKARMELAAMTDPNRPPIPRLKVGVLKKPYGSEWPGDERRDDPKLGPPTRAYSISSYYYSNGSEV